MKMTNKEYAKYAEKKSPDSPLIPDMLKAFLVGGLICCAGQALIDAFSFAGLDREAAGTAESLTLIFIGAVLTGLGVFDKIAKFAGAGTLVPITGFANSVVSPALEFKSEGYITGTAVKMFTVAGPVIVFGTVASVLYGLVLALMGIK